MRLHVTWVLLVGAILSSPEIYSRDAIRQLMHKVNGWQLANQTKGVADNNWLRATWYTGVMATYKATGERIFLQQTLDWGNRFQWQVDTGFAIGTLFCATAGLEAYQATKDKTLIEPTVKWLATPAENTPAGPRIQWYADPSYANPQNGLREFLFVDSLYAAPALAMLAKATGDTKYLTIMHRFVWDVVHDLYDEDAHLFFRDKRFIDIGVDRDIGTKHHPVGSVEALRGGNFPIWTKTQRGKKVLWSRGNGWAYGGLAWLLEYLPENDPQRPRYVKLFRDMSASLAKRQGADGLWRTNLDDPDEFPGKETSGTGFFCYGMAWGINHGLLDRQTYLPVVRRAWTGLVDCVSAEGKVQWGQVQAGWPGAVKQERHRRICHRYLPAGGQ